MEETNGPTSAVPNIAAGPGPGNRSGSEGRPRWAPHIHGKPPHKVCHEARIATNRPKMPRDTTNYCVMVTKSPQDAR